MMQSGLLNFLSQLFESTDLHPSIVIFMLLLLLLMFISAGFILFKLSRTSRSLIAVERELDEFTRNLGQTAIEDNLSPTHPNLGRSGPNLDELTNDSNQGDLTARVRRIPAALKGIKSQVLGKMLGYLSIKKRDAGSGIRSDEYASSILNNSGLKKKILELISNTDKSVSLQQLVKHLSKTYFDGNYHPIINELEQLEREGQIEGQLINAKIFYRKKQNSTRTYIRRKGRNFRKYFG